MKKHIALSLLIMSPAFIDAMEKESSYSSSKISSESEMIQNLRKEKNKFEEQLKIKKEYSSQQSPITDPFAFGFLHHCYHQNLHTNESNADTKALDFLFKKYQQTTLYGYSALGAAIIAKDTTIDKKHNFIKRLIILNFKPTQKDTELAKLILYDETIKQSKPILHILYSQANWSILPQEIRKQIKQYMVQLLRKEFWLLPETALNDL